jgi:heat shock protein HslJ
MTEMACEPAAKMDQDQWLSGQLTSGLHFALNGRTLTLTTNHVRIDLSERVSVDRPLTGTRWELQTIVTGTGPDATAEDATLTTDPATLVFEGDRVTLSAGVNGGSGPATISRGTITFGRLIVTLRPIRDDRRGQIETAVLSVLRGTVGYHLDGDALTVTATDGASALVYRAVTEATPEQ